MVTFEEKSEVIDRIINSKRSLWMLSSLSYISFEDVAQIVRIHIAKKIHTYVQQRGSFEGWISRIVINQIKNQIRNHYGKISPPCNKCPFDNGGNLCGFTKSGLKCQECKAFKKWENSKKNAYELKLAAPLEDYDGASSPSNFDVGRSVEKFHACMKASLNSRLYEAYTYLYIDHLSDSEVVRRLKFKTKEKDRIPGYRQLSNIKLKILEVANKIMKDFDIEY